MVQIASAGDDEGDLLAGLRELPVTELRLMHRPTEASQAEELVEKLRLLGLRVLPRKIVADPFLGVFSVLAEAARDQAAGADVRINVSCGPRPLGSAALAGSFFHGLRAFEIVEGKPRFFPILSLSYSDLVGPAKIRLLQAISKSDGAHASLQSFADALGMEKSLLSYHLRGTHQTKGLEALGLVRVEREGRGRLRLSLTPIGSFVVEASPDAAGDARMPRVAAPREDPVEADERRA